MLTTVTPPSASRIRGALRRNPICGPAQSQCYARHCRHSPAELRLAVRHSGIAAEGPVACSTPALGSSGMRYALYEQSAKLSNGQNTTNKFLNRGVFDYGGGLDYRLSRFFGLRGEVSDFVSGNPNLNVALSSSTQHNIVASGGISVRFWSLFPRSTVISVAPVGRYLEQIRGRGWVWSKGEN